MRLYDISLPLRPGLACWPGDAPYQWRWSMRRAEGASVNVGQVRIFDPTGRPQYLVEPDIQPMKELI